MGLHYYLGYNDGERCASPSLSEFPILCQVARQTVYLAKHGAPLLVVFGRLLGQNQPSPNFYPGISQSPLNINVFPTNHEQFPNKVSSTPFSLSNYPIQDQSFPNISKSSHWSNNSNSLHHFELRWVGNWLDIDKLIGWTLRGWGAI